MIFAARRQTQQSAPKPAELLDELQDALAHGTVARRVETLRKVTDLFIGRAPDYSDDQVSLFDDVFLCLVEQIETSAKVLLAQRLAPIPEAPPRTVRTLAFDDAIEIAAPLLSLSDRLDDATLIENARTKTQAHMLAISQRRHLSNAVTDVLVDLGNSEVIHSTAANPGAEFSDFGFAKLLQSSEGNDEITNLIGMRPSLPRHQFVSLLARASSHVRAKLQAERVEPVEDIPDAVDQATAELQTATAELSQTSVNARQLVQELKDNDQLDEAQVIAFAKAHKFDEVNLSLALLAGIAISTVEIMMVESRPECVLVLSRIIKLNWPVVSAILEMRRDLLDKKTLDLDACKLGYDRLKISTAQQVLRFHRMRQLAAR